MQRQRSEAEHRRRGRPTLKRTRTEKLPLETISDSQGLQSLILTVTAAQEKLAEDLDGALGVDPFYDAFHTEIELSEEMGLNDAAEVELRLKELLSSWTKKVMGKEAEVNIDLRTQVKGKGVAV